MPEIIATLLFSLVKRRIVAHRFDRQISLCKILYVRVCSTFQKYFTFLRFHMLQFQTSLNFAGILCNRPT